MLRGESLKSLFIITETHQSYIFQLKQYEINL